MPWRFGDLAVSAPIGAALREMGYTQPTPIQEQAVPPLQAGRDVIGLARTGSGKTAGFGIPLVSATQAADRRVQALVLVPTRELAAQVTGELSRLGSPSGVRVTAVYGGVGMGNQIAALQGRTHIVVGTPGRLLDHLGRGTLNLGAVRTVVLDEADRMLDIGFAPAIEDILRRIPVSRQTALFSATFPAEVEALAARHTRDAVRVRVDPPGAALESLEERFVRVPDSARKLDALHEILIGEECKLALVFRRTTHRTDKLARDLEHRGFRVATLHGRRSQGQRERALEALRAGKLQALVATDIAARGLDIAGLTHVINFDLPDVAETYTHRVGRTARMGAVGVAITLVAPEDEDLLRQLQRRSPSAAPAAGAPVRRHDPRPRHTQQAAGARPTPHAVPRKPETRPAAARGHAAASGSLSRQGGAPAASGVANRERRDGTRVRQAQHSARAARPAGGEQSPAREDTEDQGWYPFRSLQPARPRR